MPNLFRHLLKDRVFKLLSMPLNNLKFSVGMPKQVRHDALIKIVATIEVSSHLTSSEIEIVRLIAGGLTTKEIAHQKNISFHTVNTHRKNIFRKLNASELIIHAIKAGCILNNNLTSFQKYLKQIVEIEFIPFRIIW